MHKRSQPCMQHLSIRCEQFHVEKSVKHMLCYNLAQYLTDQIHFCPFQVFSERVLFCTDSFQGISSCVTATEGHEACISDVTKNRENREDRPLKQNFVFVMLHCDTTQLLVFLAFTGSAKGLILYFNPCQHPGLYVGQS